MNIAVLLGGISPERNISFLSGRAAVFALRERGHSVIALDPSRGVHAIVSDDELRAATAVEVTETELAGFSPLKMIECFTSALFDGIDLVFILLHGRFGEDGYVQSLLDLRGIPYTGSTMLASAAAMDKGLSKMLFQVAGIPTPFWVSVRPDQADDTDLLAEVRKEINGPMVVKPNDQGSTVGMTILQQATDEELSAAIRLAGQFIPGRELTVAVLGNTSLPIIEIVPKDGYYDYANKYTQGKTEYFCPAELSEEVQNHVQNLAIAAHNILGCRAYSRVDFRLTEDNMPYCLEVNTIPGFTETSLVPMAARAAGIEFGDLCEEIIALSKT